MSLPAPWFRLDGKVAPVTGTGGYGGIGGAVSLRLAETGARIAVAGHDGEKAAAFANVLRELGADAPGAAFDVLSVAGTERMVDQVANHFGRLAVSLKSAVFQAQAAAREMIRQGAGGKQVRIGFVRMLLAWRGRGYAAYCAAKGGLAISCKQLAAECGPHQINGNVVAPAFVQTRINATQ
jgi:gluconate 5-dehydrogenase